MSNQLASLLSKLEHDTWRDSTPFSTHLAEANEEILRAAAKSDRIAIEKILTGWLLKHQPCVFGRLASKRDLITFCTITEADIGKGDVHVNDAIQRARLAWRKEAFRGRKSGFVILVVSDRLATAVPSEAVMEFASMLASIYLERQITPDHVYNDELFLEVPTNGAILQWLVGVNYFSSQADGRWWQDHRIPGGMAFSMNSVGHMVKSAVLLEHIKNLDLALGVGEDVTEPVNLDSLPRALELAMRTILNASETPSGKATFLVERGLSGRACPVEISESLQKYDCIEYGGYYDTDVTIPSVYFRPDVVRPAQQQKLQLDFSYLVDNRFDNPDYTTVGTGRRIRGVAQPSVKTSRLVPIPVEAADNPALKQLLVRDN